MKKINKIMLAILAGIDIVFYIFTPMMISALWFNVAGYGLGSYFVFGVGLISTLFRAIKVGFLK